MGRIERIENFLNSDRMLVAYFILIIGILLISVGCITNIDWNMMMWFRFHAASVFVITFILVIVVNGLLNRRSENNSTVKFCAIQR